MIHGSLLKKLRGVPFAAHWFALGLAVCLGLLSGCKGAKDKDQGEGAPPPSQVIQVADMNLITIDKNDVPKFPVVPAGRSNPHPS